MTTMPKTSEKKPRFSEIPQFPQAHYAVDIPWRYILERVADDVKDLGLNLSPDYQRAHVWTREQQIAYVEYKLRGGESGDHVYLNQPGWGTTWDGPYELVDGKQRIEAACAFLRGDIPAFGHVFSEYKDTFPIMRPCFHWQVAKLKTRADVLRWYLAINAGGTPHNPEELRRVKLLLIEEERKCRTSSTSKSSKTPRAK